MLELGHVLQDALPILQELLLADHVVPVEVKRLKQRLDPLARMVDIAGKGLVERVNKLQLTLGDPTIVADIQLSKYSLCHVLLIHLWKGWTALK